MYSFIWCNAIVYKMKSISSSALGLSVETSRECHIDHQILGHVIRYCVRTRPPPLAVQA
jgi:hypothetical protein